MTTKRPLPLLEARWQKLTRGLWKQEAAEAAGVITRSERLQANERYDASRRALEIEAKQQNGRAN